MVAGAGDRTAATTVVDERIARFLEHPLLIADDDLRGAELEQALEPVVAVDDAPVKVVQVGRREATAVQLDHRAQIRRDDRQDRQDHPVGSCPGPAERLDQAQALDRLLAAHAGTGAHFDVQRTSQVLEAHPADDLADGFGAHARAEHAATLGTRPVALIERSVLVLAERLHRLERFELVANLLQLFLEPLRLLRELVPLVLERVLHGGTQIGHLLVDGPRLIGPALLQLGVHLLGVVADDLAQASRGVLAALLARRDHDFSGRGERDGLLGDAGLEFGQLVSQTLCLGGDLLGPGGPLGLQVRLRARQFGVELVLVLVQLRLQLVLELGQTLATLAATTLGLVLDGGQGALARVLVHVGDDVQGEVEDALQVARADVQEDARAGWASP